MFSFMKYQQTMKLVTKKGKLYLKVWIKIINKNEIDWLLFQMCRYNLFYFYDLLGASNLLLIKLLINLFYLDFDLVC